MASINGATAASTATTARARKGKGEKDGPTLREMIEQGLPIENPWLLRVADYAVVHQVDGQPLDLEAARAAIKAEDRKARLARRAATTAPANAADLESVGAAV